MAPGSSAPIVAVLSGATFTAGVAEFVPGGQIDLVSRGLGVSEAATGQLVTVFALSYGLLTPLLVAATGRIERRTLLAAALLVFAGANLVSWADPSYWTVAAARVVMAAGTGVVVVTALGAAVRLVGPQRRARAIATVLTGVTASLVLGVPAGRVVAEQWGWTAVFPINAALAGVVAVLVLTTLPTTAAPPALPLRRQLTLLRRAGTAPGLAVTFLWLGGYATLNTYLTPYLLDVVDVGVGSVGLVLLLVGVVSFAGLQVGGALTDRHGHHRTLVGTTGAHVLVLAVAPVLAVATGSGLAVVLVWAAAAWASTSAQQVRVTSLAPEAADALLGLNQSVMQLAIAAGAVVGGLVVAAGGLAVLPLVGATSVTASLVLLVLTRRRARGLDRSHLGGGGPGRAGASFVEPAA